MSSPVPPSPGREREGRDWFAIQLEVTQKLLDAENSRLAREQAEPGDALEFSQLSQRRLQSQVDQLNKEYESAASSLIRGKNLTRMRSLPSIGMKSTSKHRSSVFDMAGVDLPDQGDAADADGDAAALAPLASPPAAASGAGTVGRRSSRWLAEASAQGIVILNGRIVSGELSALIERFLPTLTSTPEKTFLFSFLLCSRLFIKPHELLGKLLERGQELIPFNPELGVVFSGILREWTENCTYDFRDERMMRPLRDLTSLCTESTADAKAAVAELQRALLLKLNSLKNYEEQLKKEYESQLKAKSETLKRGGIQKVDQTIMDVIPDPAALAEHLLFVEQERLANIGPEEFIQTFIKDADSVADRKTTRNIEACIEWCNRLTFLVATEVLHQDEKKDRKNTVEYFIEVGKICRARGNFNSMMAIVSGLNMNSVARLKKTWTKVSPKLMADFQALEWALDPSGNFKNYRDELAAFPSDQAYIPFFSLLVKDIYFSNEGHAKLLPNGHINFEKIHLVSELIVELIVQKQKMHKVKVNPDGQKFLHSTFVCNEAELFRLSVAAEPPDKSDVSKTAARQKQLDAAAENGEA